MFRAFTRREPRANSSHDRAGTFANRFFSKCYGRGACFHRHKGGGFFEFRWFRPFFCSHSLVNPGQPCPLRWAAEGGERIAWHGIRPSRGRTWAGCPCYFFANWQVCQKGGGIGLHSFAIDSLVNGEGISFQHRSSERRCAFTDWPGWVAAGPGSSLYKLSPGIVSAVIVQRFCFDASLPPFGQAIFLFRLYAFCQRNGFQKSMPRRRFSVTRS